MSSEIWEVHYHYRSMAKTNYRTYLQTDLVPIKKYFYVLRPLLSILWLEKFKSPAPIEFHRLCELIQDGELMAEITTLLERKKLALEKEVAPAIPALNTYIETELAKFEQKPDKDSRNDRNINELNGLFAELLS